MQTVNPLRRIMDNLHNFKIAPNKELLSVAVGDPTAYIEPPPSIKRAIAKAASAPNSINGYCPSNGSLRARAAIAKEYAKCSADDVVMTGGCQQALDVCFYALCSAPHHHVLLPSPGWPEYATKLQRRSCSDR